MKFTVSFVVHLPSTLAVLNISTRTDMTKVSIIDQSKRAGAEYSFWLKKTIGCCEWAAESCYFYITTIKNNTLL
jgi:hypothetical protein